jgi:endonuclease G
MARLAFIPSLAAALLLTAGVPGGGDDYSPDYPHLLMGNPSGATHDPANKNNYLMKKEYYALSYNNSKGTPNWVSWRLVKSDMGEAPRKRIFDPDMTLPPGFTRITHNDYNGSGFDRGHLCPHNDRASDRAASYATFVMTNIIPQSDRVNQRAWNELEKYCRDLVSRYHKRLYIVAGPEGQGGTGRLGYKDRIGHGRVVVPARCWKVILVLDQGRGDDLRRVNRDTRLIGVVMPNDETVGYGWAHFRVPVAAVEQLTGYRFFTAVPAAIIEPLKRERDREHIRPPAPPRHSHE